eukprot:SAG31_NODE_743_length_12418_cov_3.780908_3_plen_94_part_00
MDPFLLKKHGGPPRLQCEEYGCGLCAGRLPLLLLLLPTSAPPPSTTAPFPAPEAGGTCGAEIDAGGRAGGQAGGGGRADCGGLLKARGAAEPS